MSAVRASDRRFRIMSQAAGLLLLAGLAGCAARTVPVDDLKSLPESDAYVVTTKSGEKLDFVTLRNDGDNLVGTVRTVRKRVTGQGEQERIEMRNQYRDMTLPVSDVQTVEVRRGGPNHLLVAAAGVAAAAGIFLVLDSGSEETGPDDGGDGREPPPLPKPGVRFGHR